MELFVGSLYRYTPYFWPSIVAVLFLFALAFYSFRNRHVPGALAFSIACMLGLLWSLGSIFEFAAVDLDQKILWRKVQVLLQLPSATAITCFLLEYAWPKRWLTRRNLLFLSIVPLLAFLLIITNNFHHLFWEDFVFDDGLMVVVPGPLMNYFLAYVFVNFMMNLVIFVWVFIHSPQNRIPVAIMLFGQIMMRVLYFIDISDQIFINFPVAVFGISITSLLYAVVFFRFKILGPVPLARQALIEQLPIGMLVLNEQGKIHSLNPAAKLMLNVTNKEAKGLEVSRVLPIELQNLEKEDPSDSVEFEWMNDVGKRTVRLNVSVLEDWRQLEVGKLLLLTDITEQINAQAKIIEQQRVLATLKERDLLARELHDDLAQVFSFIHTQGQTIQRLLEKGEGQIAQEYLTRLVEVSGDGEVDIRESILGMRLSSSDGGLGQTLKKYLLQFQQNHHIQTELLIPEIFTEKTMDAMVEVQVLRILQEALTNISKHARAENVRIEFHCIDSKLCINVKDDGVGFDDMEDLYSLEDHFGLQMMRERAEAIDGQIKLTTQLGQGTEIRVCVPVNNGWKKDE